MNIKPKEMIIGEYMEVLGGVSYGFLRDKLNLNHKRIRQFRDEGYFTEKEVQTKDEKGKPVTRYIYEPKEKAIKEFGINRNNLQDSYGGIGHLVKSEDFLWKEVNENNIKLENILNEKRQNNRYSDVIQEAKLKGEKFSVCDYVIVNEETQEIERVVEIENNYPQWQKDQHKKYAEKILKKTYEYRE